MPDEQLELFDQLGAIPIQGLIEKAVELGINAEEVERENKEDIVRRLILAGIDLQEARQLVDRYAYGKGVTFSLWYLNSPPLATDVTTLEELEGKPIPLESAYYRRVEVVKVISLDDRIEILYKYSKRYSYLSEEEKHDAIWQRMIGSVWVGKVQPFLAIVGKDEKVWGKVAEFIAKTLSRSYSIIRPPIRAIDRITIDGKLCRETLISEDGESTTYAKPDGFSESQIAEVSSLRNRRMRVSGTTKLTVGNIENVSIRYNSTKGTINVRKFLPANELMKWTASAIEIILDELGKLSQAGAEEVFKAYGQKVEWGGAIPSQWYPSLNWLLGELISANTHEPYDSTVPSFLEEFLNQDKYFLASYRPYCAVCELPVGGECPTCNEILSAKAIKDGRCSNGHVLSQIVCQDNHSLSRSNQAENFWYIPIDTIKKAISRNLDKILPGNSIVNRWYIANNQLFVKAEENLATEISFSEFGLCDPTLDLVTDTNIEFVLSLKEKCLKSSLKHCLSCPGSDPQVCLMRIFKSVISGYQPQPHKGGEYGDISGQVTFLGRSLEFKGILKSNNSRLDKRTSVLLSSSSIGGDILRQVVEQGLNDSRCQLIAIVVPQVIDASLKGTLRFLCSLVSKKITFWQTEELAKVVSKYKRLSGMTY